MAVPVNHLIEVLPRRERLRLLAQCEHVVVEIDQMLCTPGVPLPNIYFPTDCSISLVARTPGHPGLEVGMIGREGMLGAHVALGVAQVPVDAIVQCAGRAWRIAPASFRAELLRNPALRECLGRYTYVLMAQLFTAATCVRFHQIGPRLARWLLMSQDRAHTSKLEMTQEFLACMLGVRRVGITLAASELQQAGLIAYRRGHLEVLNRRGLELAACDCYRTNENDYARFLG